MRSKLLITGAGAALICAALLWLRPRERPHVLLITLDTTRADHLGCYGYAGARTPVLDALAASGTLCRNAYTVAPLTLPAHASLFTGRYPAETGIRTNGRGRLDEAVPTLAEALRRHGYDTAAFIGSFVLDRKFGLERGFRTYDDDFAGEGADGGYDVQRSAAAVVDAALDWLGKQRSRPFFCWVHLYDPHFPYADHDDLFGDEFRERPYDAEIAYVDRHVGRLLDFLEAAALDSKTLVVVVGDHGEGLGEHIERTHGYTLYNEVLHVPLIFRKPGRLGAGNTVARPLSLVDLSPTILELVGLGDRHGVMGQSFSGALHGSAASASPCYAATDEPLLSEGWSPLRTLIDGPWKYVRTTRPELYDLQSDPRERENCASAQPERAGAMDALLTELESRFARREELEVQLSPNDRRKLASLGYVAAGLKAPANPPVGELPDVKDMLPHNAGVEEAAKMARDGATEGAIARLREIIRQAPGLTAAYLVLGTVLRDRGELDEAVAVLRALLDVKPDARGAHQGLGNLLLAQGRLEQAISELQQELELNPELGTAHFNLGAAYANTGRAQEALTQFSAAIDCNGQYAAAYLARADVLSRLGQPADAIADYRKAVKFAPSRAEGHLRLGLALSKDGDRGEALEHLTRAVELQPQAPEVQFALGSFLYDEGRYDGAVHHLNKALDLDPSFMAAHERLEAARRALKRQQR